MGLEIGIDKDIVTQKHVAVVPGLHLLINGTKLEKTSPTSSYSFCKSDFADKMLFKTISLTKRTSIN